ncbi:MAG: hypothetical protein NTX14_00070 [Candidatus Nealsonbacteria bacterium]|nr:hypothetical protein [Candidatus Nealsonbacteria bacterium]
MEEKINEGYISLLEASKLCSYSEPYLRLRARQGKLKSIKFGKKWMTTELWIKDYVQRTKEWNDKIAANKTAVKEIPVKQEITPEVSRSIQTSGSEVMAVGEPSPDLTKVKARKRIGGEPGSSDGNSIPDFALVLGSALMFTLAIFFAISSGNSPDASLNSVGDLQVFGQAAAKNSVEAPGERVMSYDLPMPGCVCQANGASKESGASIGNFFKLFWPW